MQRNKLGRTRKIYRPDAKLSYQIACLQGMGTRERQEDSLGLSDYQNVFDVQKKGLLAVLSDGMGGMEDGKRVSRATVDLCLELFSPFMPDIPKGLREGLCSVNRRVHAQFGGRGGATLVLVKIHEERLWWCSVGDSALFLKRGNLLLRLNEAQNLRNQLYLKEIFSGSAIDKARADADPDAARLSEFIGNTELGDLEYSRLPLKLEEDDVLLLCSDGISDAIGDIKIALALNHPPGRACDCMEGFVSELRRPNQDNYMAIVIRCAR
ncbi:MAG: SpoIIE family protein phosphatase [Clostridiales Family XIII bacterium]|jgi:protein phosphatase|nr:SpoIIE family protein phosphatase [Clostridiales Family XIII bacterium]